MVNKPKKQGTAFETWIKHRLNMLEGITADRLPEGGSRDIGDIHAATIDNELHVVLEAKARERLNPHRVLADAKEKVARGDLPFMVDVVGVVWKRLVRKKGNDRRSADGESVVVVLDWETFVWLLRR